MGFVIGSPCADAFVTKLNSTGSAFIFSTLIDGSGFEIIGEIRVNNAGMAFIAADTFPLTIPPPRNAFTRTAPTQHQAFVTAFNADGKSLYYSALISGGQNTSADALFASLRGTPGAAGASDLDYPVASDAFMQQR
jgi:hypothetical protein